MRSVQHWPLAWLAGLGLLLFGQALGVSRWGNKPVQAAARPFATCTWGGSTGDWTDPAKWTLCGGGVPGAGDTALISGGTVTVSTNVTVGTLQLTGGTLDGEGTLTVNAAMTWGNATMKGAGSTNIAAGATLNLAATSFEILDGRTVNNAGTVNLSGAGTFALQNQGVFNNLASGVFNLQSTASLQPFGAGPNVFNNAGTGGALETAENVTAESFDAVMHLHVRAALFGIKHAVPHMKAQGGGSIVSTASVAGLQNGFGPILYSIAKAGIVHMTKVAAAQLGPFNIRVNAICPGLIATPIFATSIGLARQVADTTVDAIAKSGGAQPIPRAGLPADIAEAALYLASDGSSFVNGHALVVDGGITVGPTGTAQQSALAPIMQAMGIDLAALAAIQGSAP